MQVIKRDGRVTEFNEERIIKAITLAMSHTTGGVDIDLATKITDSVKNQLKDKVQVSVYEIQDLVEKKLMGSSRKEVAQEYITYRYNRDIARKSKSKDMFLEIIETKSNDITRENANMNADTPAGMMMKFASETTKPFVDDFLLSNEARKAVKDGYIHIHDKDYYPTKSLTCIQHPLDKILKNGFRAGHGSSRPAKRIETASIIGCISLETVQNEMHGGQAIPAFDYYLAPYVRLTYKEEVKKLEKVIDQDLSKIYDAKIEDYIKAETKNLKGEEKYKQLAINNTVDRVHQSMEAFIHNMNTIHSRGGNQVVFSSINYGTDDSPEGRCIIREMLLSTEEGVGNGETPIFPIQIWKKKRGINYLPEDKNYDLYKRAIDIASRRNYPAFSFLDATYNKKYYVENNPDSEVAYNASNMREMENIIDREGKQIASQRGNISYTTINLARIGIKNSPILKEMSKSKEKQYEEFFNELEDKLNLVKDQLLDRFETQGNKKAYEFPFFIKQGVWMDAEKAKDDDRIRKVIKQGSLTVGFMGLEECLIALTGKKRIDNKETQKLGIQIISFMKSKVEEFSNKYNLNFSLMGTEDKELAEEFIATDKAIYGNLKGITDKNIYTNSFYIDNESDIKDKIKIEAPYHELTNGGHVLTIDITEASKEELENILRNAKENNIGFIKF